MDSLPTSVSKYTQQQLAIAFFDIAKDQDVRRHIVPELGKERDKNIQKMHRWTIHNKYNNIPNFGDLNKELIKIVSYSHKIEQVNPNKIDQTQYKTILDQVMKQRDDLNEKLKTANPSEIDTIKGEIVLKTAMIEKTHAKMNGPSNKIDKQKMAAVAKRIYEIMCEDTYGTMNLHQELCLVYTPKRPEGQSTGLDYVLPNNERDKKFKANNDWKKQSTPRASNSEYVDRFNKEHSKLGSRSNRSDAYVPPSNETENESQNKDVYTPPLPSRYERERTDDNVNNNAPISNTVDSDDVYVPPTFAKPERPRPFRSDNRSDYRSNDDRSNGDYRSNGDRSNGDRPDYRSNSDRPDYRSNGDRPDYRSNGDRPDYRSNRNGNGQSYIERREAKNYLVKPKDGLGDLNETGEPRSKEGFTSIDQLKKVRIDSNLEFPSLAPSREPVEESKKIIVQIGQSTHLSGKGALQKLDDDNEMDEWSDDESSINKPVDKPINKPINKPDDKPATNFANIVKSNITNVSTENETNVVDVEQIKSNKLVTLSKIAKSKYETKKNVSTIIDDGTNDDWNLKY